MGNTSTETTGPQPFVAAFFYLGNPTSLSARIMSDAKSKASASFAWREAGKPYCNGNGFLGLPREISKNHTPLKLNMVPEKWWLEVRKLLSFLERQILRGYAKLPGSTMTWEWITNKTTSANWHFLLGKWEDSIQVSGRFWRHGHSREHKPSPHDSHFEMGELRFSLEWLVNGRSPPYLSSFVCLRALSRVVEPLNWTTGVTDSKSFPTKGSKNTTRKLAIFLKDQTLSEVEARFFAYQTLAVANHSRSHLSFKSFSLFSWGSKPNNFLLEYQHLIWYSFKTTSCLPFWQNLAWRTASSTWLRCWIPLDCRHSKLKGSEILHQLIGSWSRNSQGFLHLKWLFGISSINSIISIIESQNEWVSSDWWKSSDLIHRFELEASQLNSSANSDTRTHEKGWLFKPPTTPYDTCLRPQFLSWEYVLIGSLSTKVKMKTDATTKQRTNDYSTGNIYPQKYLILHHLIKAPFLRCSVIKHCQWEENQKPNPSLLNAGWFMTTLIVAWYNPYTNG